MQAQRTTAMALQEAATAVMAAADLQGLEMELAVLPRILVKQAQTAILSLAAAEEAAELLLQHLLAAAQAATAETSELAQAEAAAASAGLADLEAISAAAAELAVALP